MLDVVTDPSTSTPLSGAPPLHELARAIDSMPGHAVLSHRSAALLWGLWIPRFDGTEVCSPAGPRGGAYTTSVQRGSVIAHRHRVPDAEITTRFGMPVMTIERTWLSLAQVLDVHDLIAAGDRALAVGADREILERLVAAAGSARGIRLARRALPHLDLRSKSRPESRIRAAIVLAGLPKPQVNKTMYDRNGDWLGEPDLAYEEATLALEYNGAVHDEKRRGEKDSVRLLAFQRADWTVRTYTAPHAFRRMHEVVADVTTLLMQLAPQLLTSRTTRRVTRRPITNKRVAPSLGA